ncbi:MULTISPECIES: Crp/Fnr family transcriptional regulator [Methylocystis]|uniref:Transcriptional regulator n=1 Tax=Methylocystis iwaonis TaxID=2885079 RepID=A0ABM8E818_9HYPH|nr:MULTISPECIES: Crp/Fnr family transcriptional regulator [Methylocystis]MBL1258271.1 Crp/Fnr family transcriptional regulator [Methylocystis sp. Sn-Cys]BDV34009.1 transcriptional regulator [Methylocystis iwaonis]
MSVFDGIPFFAGLDPSRGETFGRQCIRKRFSEGELVLDFDDPSTDVYFIVSGDVRVLIRTAAGKEMILGDFGPGNFFGEMAAIDGAKRSANVTALTNAELLLVPPTAFREIVLHSPEIAERLMRLLTSRVRELNVRLFERSVLDLRHRLYAELLRMASPRKGHDGQSIVSPPPFQHDLAARIGCRREQVSRELGAMTEEGLAEKVRGGLVLLRPNVLEKRVRDAMNAAE